MPRRLSTSHASTVFLRRRATGSAALDAAPVALHAARRLRAATAARHAGRQALLAVRRCVLRTSRDAGRLAPLAARPPGLAGAEHERTETAFACHERDGTRARAKVSN